VLLGAARISGAIVVLLAWDDARRNLVASLRARGIPVRVWMVAASDAAPPEPGRWRPIRATSASCIPRISRGARASMMAPIGLMGLSLAAWGFALGHPVVGAVFGALVEACRLVRPALAALRRGAARALRVVFLVAIVAFVILVATQRPPHSLYMWLRGLAILFAPLPLIQVLSGGSLSYAALRHSMRFSGTPQPDARRWDATNGYALCCLAGASTVRSADEWFYVAGLRAHRVGNRGERARAPHEGPRAPRVRGPPRVRSRHGPLPVPGADRGMGRGILRRPVHARPRSVPRAHADRRHGPHQAERPDRHARRARGAAADADPAPRVGVRLLSNNAWETSSRSVRPVPREGEAWRLRPGMATRASSSAFVSARRWIAAVAGRYRVDPRPRCRDGGSDRSEGGPREGRRGPVAMRVSYDEENGHARDRRPRSRCPRVASPVLEKIVATEGIRAGSPREVHQALERFFGTGFAYSLQLSQRDSRGGRSLAEFLVTDRKGHCEYFATATVLLLRQAGIPARYAVGYSAQEFSALERAFVVRNRHAHAWALALVDGRWVTVDTTPANWAELEARSARSPFGAVIDVFSWLWDRARRAWDAADASELALAGLVLAFLLASPWLARRLPRLRPAAPRAAAPDRVAAAWSAVERAPAPSVSRATRAKPSAPGRAVSQTNPAARPWHASLTELAALYYRSRFDPAAPADAAEQLVALARDWGLTPGSDPGVRPRTISR
jgi:transglutaminase-like putative cysteine protease